MTDKLIAQAKEMGLEGPDILQYAEKQQAIVEKQQAIERDERIQYKAGQKQAAEEVKAKTPRLPSFTEGEEIDGYLLRFERFARANHWAEVKWASSLSALLTGKALDVYSRLSDAEAQDYDKVKEAILRRYELTEDGFRKTFRSEIPQEGEGPGQYIVRLTSYLKRWIELSGTAKTFEGVCDLIIQEQFLDLCPMDMAIHLRERKPKSLEEVGILSQQ
ncbi:SCAN domain-containing protein 3-like [Branchiostoma floridae x Branchiostoma belcheri]